MRRINPNDITSLRLFIFTPLACFFLMQGYLSIVLVAIVLGELSDFFDGQIARRTGQISDFGKLYDPMCDSIFHTVVWMSFQAVGWVSVYFVILFFVRDIVVNYIRIYFATQKIVLAARMTGKIKAAMQGVAQISIVALHLFCVGSMLENAQLLIVLLAAFATIFSLGDYSMNFYRQVKKDRLCAQGK